MNIYDLIRTILRRLAPKSLFEMIYGPSLDYRYIGHLAFNRHLLLCWQLHIEESVPVVIHSSLPLSTEDQVRVSFVKSIFDEQITVSTRLVRNPTIVDAIKVYDKRNYDDALCVTSSLFHRCETIALWNSAYDYDTPNKESLRYDKRGVLFFARELLTFEDPVYRAENDVEFRDITSHLCLLEDIAEDSCENVRLDNEHS